MVSFGCFKCGSCCHEYPFAEDEPVKRIPVFLDEIDKLEDYASENDIPVKFLEDVVFPDIHNEKILVITYKIILDGPERSCPFFKNDLGCLINDFKPLACKAFPVAQKLVDACHHSFSFDPYCQFVEKYEKDVSNISPSDIEKWFPNEYEYSRQLMKKNQDIILRLKQLTTLKCLNIPDSLSPEKMNKSLKDWDRETLDDFLNK